jgi:hypothetical protein
MRGKKYEMKKFVVASMAHHQIYPRVYSLQTAPNPDPFTMLFLSL